MGLIAYVWPKFENFGQCSLAQELKQVGHISSKPPKPISQTQMSCGIVLKLIRAKLSPDRVRHNSVDFNPHTPGLNSVP